MNQVQLLSFFFLYYPSLAFQRGRLLLIRGLKEKRTVYNKGFFRNNEFAIMLHRGLTQLIWVGSNFVVKEDVSWTTLNVECVGSLRYLWIFQWRKETAEGGNNKRTSVCVPKLVGPGGPHLWPSISTNISIRRLYASENSRNVSIRRSCHTFACVQWRHRWHEYKVLADWLIVASLCLCQHVFARHNNHK